MPGVRPRRLRVAQEIRDHPVTQVSHTHALAYCASAGRCLPTEAQWEFAAGPA
ncbi:SUMF1/EgtB/PvdO family nonheme iron enzyme [Arthrobacter sp. STN4]|uniref:SUMF1/EgtB/PvdO family nonheme iron enzyme n=1 Tax=Arthrobacter sp. STN4 TaxID=2923276 RepID=UPI00277B4DB4|nr:SUMF1/EgtB/PvdO family nonheme iron enzyme [Arthrobacter sp. STN4]